MSETVWYYSSHGKPEGPVSEADLRAQLRSGILEPETLVWCEGMPDWAPATSITTWKEVPLPPPPGATPGTGMDTPSRPPAPSGEGAAAQSPGQAGGQPNAGMGQGPTAGTGSMPHSAPGSSTAGSPSSGTTSGGMDGSTTPGHGTHGAEARGSGAQGSGAQGSGAQGSGTHETGTRYGQAAPRIPTHLVKAILATLFCCMPLGIIAIVKAAQANSLIDSGNYEKARASAKGANTWANWSIGMGVILYVVGLMIGTLGALSEWAGM